MNHATRDFIQCHQDGDVRQLAFLAGKYPEVDLPFALDQIQGRKTARQKLPRWASVDGIVYPPHISMEQCSSEQTAFYKAELAERLVGKRVSKGSATDEMNAGAKDESTDEAKNGVTDDVTFSFADLTGGFGVDFSYIAARLGVRSLYVERQAHLCEVAKENFSLLQLDNAVVKNGDGIETLHDLDHLRLIYIDPARRDGAGNKVVSLQDCTPDVTLLQDEMLAKADSVIIKLSPMLDWHRALQELHCVREVHIVSCANECKELLLVLSENSSDGEEEGTDVHLYAVNINGANPDTTNPNGSRNTQTFHCFMRQMERASLCIAEPKIDSWHYLYEPNTSLMKMGCYGLLSEHYGVEMLAPNSHLFVSEEPVEAFPGRCFAIQAVTTLNKKELKHHLAGMTQANIATRNFPLSVAELRKRLKLKDGGEDYLFATTLSDGTHAILKVKR